MVLPIGNDWDNAAVAEVAPQRFTIVTLVQSQPLRATSALAHPDAINGFENVDLVIPVGSAQGEVERVSIRLDDDMAFQA
jgi:hypothetical protein